MLTMTRSVCCVSLFLKYINILRQKIVPKQLVALSPTCMADDSVVPFGPIMLSKHVSSGFHV